MRDPTDRRHWRWSRRPDRRLQKRRPWLTTASLRPRAGGRGACCAGARLGPGDLSALGGEDGLDELKFASGTQRAGGDLQRCEGDRADELDRYPRDLAGAGWVGGFDGPGQQRGGGAAVLYCRRPRFGGAIVR